MAVSGTVVERLVPTVRVPVVIPRCLGHVADGLHWAGARQADDRLFVSNARSKYYKGEFSEPGIGGNELDASVDVSSADWRKRVARGGRWDRRAQRFRAWSEKSRAFWSARLDALDELLKAEDAAATQQTDKKGKPK